MKKMLFFYDYSGGSVWAFIWANSVEEVLQEYPRLEYASDFPDWFSEDLKKKISEKETYVLGQVKSGWLSVLNTSG